MVVGKQNNEEKKLEVRKSRVRSYMNNAQNIRVPIL
jgi:hypothetical protein